MRLAPPPPGVQPLTFDTESAAQARTHRTLAWARGRARQGEYRPVRHHATRALHMVQTLGNRVREARPASSTVSAHGLCLIGPQPEPGRSHVVFGSDQQGKVPLYSAWPYEEVPEPKP